jgi:hypothetical protein
MELGPENGSTAGAALPWLSRNSLELRPLLAASESLASASTLPYWKRNNKSKRYDRGRTGRRF